MHIYGITGPSGSGKSLLCEYLSAHGVAHINADAVYHALLLPPSPAAEAIAREFGPQVITPDGGVDRPTLAKLVFQSPEQLERLNQTVLPIVLDEVRARLARMESEGVHAVAIDAPTLIESGFDGECDTVIVVLSAKEERILRVVTRDGLCRERAEERIEAQRPDAFYTEKADVVLYNNGDEKAFFEQARDAIPHLNQQSI